MRAFRWCSSCERAFAEDDLAQDRFGMPACPMCGAGVLHLKAWQYMKNELEERDAAPESGEHYSLAER